MDEIKRPAHNAATDVYGGERRRTQRVQIAMPVLIRGKSGDKVFEEEATTISISANDWFYPLLMKLRR